MVTDKTTQQLNDLARQIRACTACPLHASRTRAVPGAGPSSATVMFIGEAPGEDEDRQGQPFVGAAGRVLNRLLESHGIDRDDLFITNIVKCRPERNRTPRKHEIDTCTARYLFSQIALVDPRVIVVLGRTAAKTLLGVQRLSDVRGRAIEHDNRQYLVAYHPAAAFYRAELQEQIEADFALLADTLRRA